ncbi:MAG: GSCFA domain-containing protein [Cyclobacteriaceae bacterium]
MGSCFADQFGLWLKSNKFPVSANAFGTTYNPICIHQLLLQSLEDSLDESLFVKRDGFWYHYQYHSQWLAPTREELTQTIRQQQNAVKEFVKTTDVLILTYGTAWVYHLQPTDQLVSNCHKVPASQFTKQLLTEIEIKESFDEFYKKLKSINPAIRIILTVSPVRHIKDSLELNSVSKGLLRLVCYQFVNHYDSVEYFPAYEIMMDDLRDYRFYERDMIHPSAEAKDYINQKFSDCYFSEDTRSFIKTWTGIQKALAHRPFQLDSPAHQKFLKDTLQKLESLSNRVSVSEEIQLIQTQLHA